MRQGLTQKERKIIMKLILIQDVKSLGKKDSVVEVSDGYGRNYLIPKGLAVEASKGNLNEIQNKKEAEKNKKAREEAKAKELAEKIQGKTFTIKAKAGENGKLFGAVSNKDVADVIEADTKLAIDKKKIELGEPVKSIGIYDVEAKIYPGVSAKFKIDVTSDQ